MNQDILNAILALESAIAALPNQVISAGAAQAAAGAAAQAAQTSEMQKVVATFLNEGVVIQAAIIRHLGPSVSPAAAGAFAPVGQSTQNRGVAMLLLTRPPQIAQQKAATYAANAAEPPDQHATGRRKNRNRSPFRHFPRGISSLRQGISQLRQGNLRQGMATLQRGMKKMHVAGRAAGRALGLGEAGATGLGNAAAAAGPVAAVVVVAAAAASALKNFADAALAANKQFVGFSAGMSMVFAQRDMQEAFRKMRVGAGLTESAQHAMHEEQRFNTAAEPWEIAWGQFKNNVARETYGMFADLVESVNKDDPLLALRAVSRTGGIGVALRALHSMDTSPSGSKPEPFETARDYAQAEVERREQRAKEDAARTGMPFRGLPESLKAALREGAEQAWAKQVDLLKQFEANKGLSFSLIASSLGREANRKKREAAKRLEAMKKAGGDF